LRTSRVEPAAPWHHYQEKQLSQEKEASCGKVWKDAEREKRDVYCDKQVGKAVTVLNYMLKGS